MANYRNYGVKYSNGMFYETSKTQQEGFNVETQNGKGDTYYHKECTTVKGTLNKVAIEDSPYGQRLKLYIDEGNDVVGVVAFSVFNNFESIDGYTKSITAYLGNLNIGDSIEMWLNRKSKNSRDRLYQNVHLKANDAKVEWVFHPNTDVPKAVQKEDKNPVTGDSKTVWDFTAVDKFYYDKLKEGVEAFGNQPATTTATAVDASEVSTEKVAPTVTQLPQATTTEQYADDLPF